MDDSGNDEDHDLDDFVETLSRVMSHAANEPLLIKRIERYLSPSPAHIYNSDEEAADLTRHVQKFTNRLEPEQRLLITKIGELPSWDDRIRTYHMDISNELTDSFHVCRTAVCRMHMFYIALETTQTNRDLWVNMSDEDAEIYAHVLNRSVWEALEIATIRLTSYWDRVGQILDFVFFNIRQYERDGFPAVLERIKKNFAPTFPEIASDASYRALLEYANSEKATGFKWLVRRRNLAVHSTRFRPHQDKRDAVMEYEFNHYRARVIRDLALKTPKEELEIIHGHLARAAELFRGVFDLACVGLDVIKQDVSTRGRS